MNREELKAAVKKAYDKGYHEGVADTCDTVTQALINVIITTMAKIKEAAQEAKAEVVDELEGIETYDHVEINK